MTDGTDSQPPQGNRGMIFLAAVVLIFCTLMILRRVTPPSLESTDSSSSPAPKLAEMRPKEEPKDGYIGSESCRECHQGQHESWHASYHRTMTQAAHPSTSIGDFKNVTLRVQGTNKVQQFHLRQNEDSSWVEFLTDKELIPGPEGQPVAFPVVMTTGSHHMQAYWMGVGPGRTVGLLPFVYLREGKRWIPRRSAFLNFPIKDVTLEAGKWDNACIRCHTTGGRPNTVRKEAHTYFDSATSEYGISCEACHGKAAEHVRIRRHAQATGTSPAIDPIVNPDDLPHSVSSQVCGSCHSALIYHADGVPHVPGKSLDTNVFELMGVNQNTRDYFANFYHSGEDSPEDIQFTVQMVMDGTFWADGQTRLVGREYTGLSKSACHTQGTIACTSCHKLHKAKSDSRALPEWADDQLDAGMRGDTACTQCHDAKSFATPAHTHHRPGSSGSQCMNCHMPHTNYGLLKAARTHSITSPSIRETLDTARPNACNLCHLDKTMAWTATQLNDWYGIKSPKLKNPWTDTAASVVGALRGDASVRALIAWHYGWQPARAASAGNDWIPPMLTLLMDDQYDAVRYIANHSLERIKGYQDLGFDFIAPRQQRHEVIRKVMGRWNELAPTTLTNRPAILILPGGEIDTDAVDSHIANRDNRPVSIHE